MVRNLFSVRVRKMCGNTIVLLKIQQGHVVAIYDGRVYKF